METKITELIRKFAAHYNGRAITEAGLERVFRDLIDRVLEVTGKNPTTPSHPLPQTRKEEYTMTSSDASKFLSRNRRAITEYVKRGLLHPKKGRSKRGTLEYRFSKSDLEQFKQRYVDPMFTN